MECHEADCLPRVGQDPAAVEEGPEAVVRHQDRGADSAEAVAVAREAGRCRPHRRGGMAVPVADRPRGSPVRVEERATEAVPTGDELARDFGRARHGQQDLIWTGPSGTMALSGIVALWTNAELSMHTAAVGNATDLGTDVWIPPSGRTGPHRRNRGQVREKSRKLPRCWRLRCHSCLQLGWRLHTPSACARADEKGGRASRGAVRRRRV